MQEFCWIVDFMAVTAYFVDRLVRCIGARQLRKKFLVNCGGHDILRCHDCSFTHPVVVRRLNEAPTWERRGKLVHQQNQQLRLHSVKWLLNPARFLELRRCR